MSMCIVDCYFHRHHRSLHPLCPHHILPMKQLHLPKAGQNQFLDYLHHFHLHNYQTRILFILIIKSNLMMNFMFIFHPQHTNLHQVHYLSFSYIFDIPYNFFLIPPFFSILLHQFFHHHL